MTHPFDARECRVVLRAGQALRNKRGREKTCDEEPTDRIYAHAPRRTAAIALVDSPHIQQARCESAMRHPPFAECRTDELRDGECRSGVVDSSGIVLTPTRSSPPPAAPRRDVLAPSCRSRAPSGPAGQEVDPEPREMLTLKREGWRARGHLRCCMISSQGTVRHAGRSAGRAGPQTCFRVAVGLRSCASAGVGRQLRGESRRLCAS